jgi:hypothetical protein
VGERERIAPGCEETLQQRRRAPRFEVAGYDTSIKVERRQWILFACEATCQNRTRASTQDCRVVAQIAAELLIAG